MMKKQVCYQANYNVISNENKDTHQEVFLPVRVPDATHYKANYKAGYVHFVSYMQGICVWMLALINSHYKVIKYVG